ncbi:MAG: hypothetical protein AB8E82_13560 [Aureispira sp.]
MKNAPYFSLLLSIIIIGMMACNRPANNNNKEEVQKESTKTLNAKDVIGNWVVSSLLLTNQEPINPSKYYTLNITAETMGIPLDINQCGTNYQTKKDSLIVDPFMMCTEACCDSKEAIQISKFLSGPLHFSMTNGLLQLSHKKGTLTLSPAKADLIGHTWEAVNYQALNSEEKPVTFSKSYTLLFEPMSAVLKLDVNSCSGAVSFSKDAFEIAKGLGCSRQCCDSKDGILLKDMLTGKNSYILNGNAMTVTTVDHKIEFKKIAKGEER